MPRKCGRSLRKGGRGCEGDCVEFRARWRVEEGEKWREESRGAGQEDREGGCRMLLEA
jgi:hypothetical protein